MTQSVKKLLILLLLISHLLCKKKWVKGLVVGNLFKLAIFCLMLAEKSKFIDINVTKSRI